VALTTFLQSKTTVVTTTDEKARAQQQMMTIMLPFMFAFFALSFPSGVSLYWVVNAIVAIVFNIVIYGLPRFGIAPLMKPKKKPVPVRETPPLPPGQRAANQQRTPNGPGRSKRQNRRRRA
jgi:YidC/Oxa1 family membrane protein insertase